ncbi:MAG TPA: TRZ/ATZ family hydrolase [Pseudomonadales bacterium]|jgi:5-methylthioadenosine/S-adenosylhomocysteine deaminase|nr:TRZ/ATZ family hydrolase [Pseudomonadales bacterium]
MSALPADAPHLQQIDLLIEARWIIPIIPAGEVLEHQAIAIDQGAIRDLLPSTEARQKYRPRQHLTLHEHVLLPGLVNAHGHAAMSLFRGLADDLPMMEWLTDHIWPAEQHWVSETFVEDGTELAIAEMLRSGTSCFADMYFFPDRVARVASRSGIRAQVCFPVLDFPTLWAQQADDYLHKGLMLHDDYRDHPRVRIAFGPHAPYSVSDAPLSRIATLAEELDLSIQIHLHETAQEVEEAMARSGRRPLMRLGELGLLSPRLQAVHMTQLLDSEIELLARHGVHVIHCPRSNLKLASGMAPVARLLDAGVNVALGTDSAASNNSLNLFDELAMAALLGKGVSGDARAIDAHRALELATLGGARALGLGEQIGSLEAGKLADLIAVRLDDINQQPLYHPASQLVYSASGNRVSHLWVAGRPLLSDGQLQSIDLASLRERVNGWAARIGTDGIKGRP